MAETIEELIAKLPSDEELVKAAINNLRRYRNGRSRRQSPAPLWSRVGGLFGHGSGYSTAICVKYGFDPEEIWRPE